MSMTKKEASSFLNITTLGPTKRMIDALSLSTKEAWIDNQLSISPELYAGKSVFEGKAAAIWNDFKVKISTKHPSAISDASKKRQILPYWYYWRMAFWDTTLKVSSEDHLRHKAALALSEILVISDQSNLELNGLGLSNYYDLLYKNAFESYEDLLYSVAIHPCMGIYLTHMNNPKEAGNNHPDENFAREIMQLFTIGLYELDADGNANSDNPAYGPSDVKELAKVFTGLKPAHYWDAWDSAVNGQMLWADSRNTIPTINMTESMVVENSEHDQSSKSLLNAQVTLASGQSGLVEIRSAIAQLCRHHNTGFFVAKKLIQLLVISNPSSHYVKRVASVFKNERAGKVGHLGSVFKAIFLDPEASSPKKLKSPMHRCIQILKSFEVKNDDSKLYLLGEEIQFKLNQHPLSSPTVFNFYLPDHRPNGEIDKAGKVAPEFELHNAATSIEYINLMYSWFFSDHIMAVSNQAHGSRFDIPENRIEVLKDVEGTKLKFDFTDELALAAKPDLDELIDFISLKLMGSDVSANLRREILDAVSLYRSNHLWVVQTCAFIICISPEFCIQS